MIPFEADVTDIHKVSMTFVFRIYLILTEQGNRDDFKALPVRQFLWHWALQWEVGSGH
jgi:hypothetical protein